MTVMGISALAAGVIGGVMALTGGNPTSAATLAPALVQAGGEQADVQQVDHNRRTRPGWKGLRSSRSYGPNYGYRYGNRYRRSGPAVGFGLSVPGFSFGIGTPAPPGLFLRLQPAVRLWLRLSPLLRLLMPRTGPSEAPLCFAGSGLAPSFQQIFAIA